MKLDFYNIWDWTRNDWCFVLFRIDFFRYTTKNNCFGITICNFVLDFEWEILR